MKATLVMHIVHMLATCHLKETRCFSRNPGSNISNPLERDCVPMESLPSCASNPFSCKNLTPSKPILGKCSQKQTTPHKYRELANMIPRLRLSLPAANLFSKSASPTALAAARNQKCQNKPIKRVKTGAYICISKSSMLSQCIFRNQLIKRTSIFTRLLILLRKKKGTIMQNKLNTIICRIN